MLGLIVAYTGYYFYIQLKHEPAYYPFNSNKYKMLKFYLDTKKEYEEEKRLKQRERLAKKYK